MRSIMEILIIIYLSLFALGTGISERKKFEKRNGLFNLLEIAIYIISILIVFIIVMALPLKFTEEGFLVNETIYVVPLLIAFVATGYLAFNFIQERKIKNEKNKKVSKKKEKDI